MSNDPSSCSCKKTAHYNPDDWTNTNGTCSGCGRQREPLDEKTKAAIAYADYILNHYSKNSHADKFVLAKDLLAHGWKQKKESNEG